MPQMITADRSSLLLDYGYNPKVPVLLVRYKKSPSTLWKHVDVPQSLVDGMARAKSIGSYFLAHIRDQYPGEITSEAAWKRW